MKRWRGFLLTAPATRAGLVHQPALDILRTYLERKAFSKPVGLNCCCCSGLVWRVDVRRDVPIAEGDIE